MARRNGIPGRPVLSDEEPRDPVPPVVPPQGIPAGAVPERMAAVPAPIPERPRVINIEQLRTAQATLEKYKDGKANLDRKIIENEDWWKLNHFRNFRRMKYVRNEETGEILPVHDHPQHRKQSAWLFNSIMNKHADIMDNYPEPAILPRERSDEDAAKVLSSILPVIMEV